MARPFKCRRVAFLPGVTFFKPAGVPLRFLEEVILTVDETEAVRLKDIGNIDQTQCAKRMNISRPTFQRILYSARRKMADALLNGKAIRIEGGHFVNVTLNSDYLERCNTDKDDNVIQKEGDKMKIAVVTDDGKTICQHFGRAQFYTVVTIENGKEINQEQRPKAGHHVAGMQHESHVSSGTPHGFDAHAQASHSSMMANITDCQLVIAGGMGWGAQESLKQAGIAVHMTDIQNINEAVKLYLEGKLPNLTQRLH
jgi:predicted DNA-binding protein (UPF0251 family)/predicted Fe-Mo cluster-binding NifX family protein